jgi:hypothetical protein
MKAAAAEPAAATAAKTSTATATKAAATVASATMLDFGRQSISCVLRSRSRAGTCER